MSVKVPPTSIPIHSRFTNLSPLNRTRALPSYKTLTHVRTCRCPSARGVGFSRGCTRVKDLCPNPRELCNGLGTPIAEMRRHVLEPRMTPILVGENSLGISQRPGDTEVGIVPCQTAITFGRVEVGDLIDHLRLGLERAKAVRKALGNPKLGPVLRRQHHRDMAAKGG